MLFCCIGYPANRATTHMQKRCVVFSSVLYINTECLVHKHSPVQSALLLLCFAHANALFGRPCPTACGRVKYDLVLLDALQLETKSKRSTLQHMACAPMWRGVKGEYSTRLTLPQFLFRPFATELLWPPRLIAKGQEAHSCSH